MRRLGVHYPAVQDNDYVIWYRFGVRAWPTAVIIDKESSAIATSGGYEEAEAVIQRPSTEQE